MTARPDRARRWLPGVIGAAVLALALAELVVLILVGRWIGVWWTLALLLAESVAGIWVVKHEGRRAWDALRTALVAGQLPDRQVADAALVLAGGILLLTPGFLTDLAGFTLMAPPTRRLARPLLAAVVARATRSALLGSFGEPTSRASRDGDVIAGDVLNSHDEPMR